jgi:ABC-type ATPase involved in cell division
MTGSAFELKEASVGYNGRPMLTDIDLTIAHGERVAVMGRSGAGKSTLIKVLFAQRPAEVALIPQTAALVKTLSVFHNVFMGRLDRHSTLYNVRSLVWPARFDIDEIRGVLDGVGLADKLFAAAGTLSGGQQQRASVARALYNGRPSSATSRSRHWTGCRDPKPSPSCAGGMKRWCSSCTTSPSHSNTPIASSSWNKAARYSTRRPPRSPRLISCRFTEADWCRASPMATRASPSYSQLWCA